ncbi:MAG: SPOR domain-containing protein [Gallionella sp.]|nr:SPOR domain-containing protein [Gallionella sp.]
MIRILIWILLLSNIVFFAAMQWGPQLLGGTVVVEAPLNADKMRLLDPAQVLPPEKTKASVGASAAIPANMQAAPDPATPSADISKVAVCLEWGEFSDAELASITAVLSPLELGGKLSTSQIIHTIGYWAYIPPLKDKAAIDAKIEQLKARGVTEYFVVQETGIWMNAISLGVFKTQETAQNFLGTLRSKGVRSAQVGQRNSKLKVSILKFTEVDTATEDKLIEIQKDFSSTALNKVSCGLTR